MKLSVGMGVRIRSDYVNKAMAGKDAMVVDDYGDWVSLIFPSDEAPAGTYYWPEAWEKTELDMSQ